MIVAVLLGVFCFLNQAGPCRWVVRQPAACFSMIISLSVEYSNLRKILLPGPSAWSSVFDKRSRIYRVRWILILMIGMFMSHVNGLLRYGYPFIAATPLIYGYTVYAVSQSQKAVLLTDAPSERKQPKRVWKSAPQLAANFKASLKGAFRKTSLTLKKLIRKALEAILRHLDDNKE